MGLLYRKSAVAGLADYLDIGLGGKDRGETGPHHALVVTEQHPDGLISHAVILVVRLSFPEAERSTGSVRGLAKYPPSELPASVHAQAIRPVAKNPNFGVEVAEGRRPETE